MERAAAYWVMPRSSPPLSVSQDQQEQIEQWLAALGTPQQVALRCRIVLAASCGTPEMEIAAALKINRKTVRLWRERFGAGRLAGVVGDRAGPRTQSDLRPRPRQGSHRYNSAIETQREYPLELSNPGGCSEE